MSLVNANPLILAAGGDYQISRSVRLRNSASAYFSRTYATSPTNNKINTFSGWVKRGTLGTLGYIFTAYDGTSALAAGIWFQNDKLWAEYGGPPGSGRITTTQVFRDPSAWYHIVLAIDTTQATASNRVKLYINGVQVTAFDTATNPTLNLATAFTFPNGNNRVGANWDNSGPFDGYLTEINFIDGQALTPSSFGETNPITGVWQPKQYAGTYGTNGFFLKFSDNSAATATTIGKDYSGNGNNWTPNNISVTAGVTYDSMLDVPTAYADGGNGRGNYCVLNSLSTPQFTITNANLNWSITSSASNALYLKSTLAVSSGKWYWEVTPTDVGGGPNLFIGIQDSTYSPNSAATDNVTSGYAYKADGNKVTGGTASAYGASYTNNDVIGVALDMDAGTLVFYKNNTSQGTAFSSLSGSYLPILVHNVGGVSRTSAGSVNYGQRPFTYTPPTGFKALNTGNLPEPTIVNGSKWMNATTYTGNGSTQTISGVQFAPDLVWIKNRGSVTDHGLFDTVRGATKRLASNLTNAETTEVNSLTAFTSSGFTVGATQDFNQNGVGLVAWQWKESVTPGFDIVTYSGAGSVQNVAHSLGVAPSMMIVKCRSTGGTDWAVYHRSLGGTKVMVLNSTSAAITIAGSWNNTDPTSSVFTVGTGSGSGDTNFSGRTYVNYLFAPIAGFSAFGSYTGNGSTDGPFVYLGFRPRYVMIKVINNTYDWEVADSSRSPDNFVDDFLVPNSSAAENANVGAANSVDFLSNGFKIRANWTRLNDASGTFIYMAFAENPFKYALAR